MPPGTRQIELTWTCSSCGHGNRGRDKACQGCGDPKDASERYEMPGATAAAATVTDPHLVRLATAGADWRCSFWRQRQRRLDGTCATCGASVADAVVEAPPPAVVLTWWQRCKRWVKAHPVAAGLLAATVVAIVAVVGARAWANRTRTFTSTVAAVRWDHAITVERYQVWAREGWRQDAPAAAFAVRSLGQRIHHYDEVLDGYDTEYYTEQVACGEDCTTEPEHCSESCTDNANGFATCTTTCTGGGQSCSTRYCSEQRSRQVPRYRKEPRYAEAVAYQVWDWGDHRTVHARGAAVTGLRWPTEEALTGVGLAEREQERERRAATYAVTLAYDGAARITVAVTPEAFPGFAVGTKHRLRLKGKTVAVDGVPVVRAPAADQPDPSEEASAGGPAEAPPPAP
ncbi:MAG: hypothetical protein R3B06_03425 [Kofleriaceae bacterium]